MLQDAVRISCFKHVNVADVQEDIWSLLAETRLPRCSSKRFCFPFRSDIRVQSLTAPKGPNGRSQKHLINIERVLYTPDTALSARAAVLEQ